MASEGKAVSAAYKGPDISHDQLIGKSEEFNREDGQRASSAGETRQKIGQLLDTTAMNGKAFSWLRQILKVNDKANGQEKAMDIIRSLEKCLPMVRDHVSGQGTKAMDLSEPEAEPKKAAGKKKAPIEPATIPVEEAQDAETAEFNAEVDETLAGDDTVTPFDPDETPIDFGGDAA